MNISWVLADSVLLDPTLDPADLKRVGPIWGSWRTWRACQTDNVICHDMQKAADLVKRQFQNNCNFYLPNSVHASLDRPDGVRLYEGDFVHDVDRQEEIVALHLAASTSDIVLLLGFDLTPLSTDTDRLLTHRAQHHRNLLRQAMANYDQVQWVVVDHQGNLDPKLANLDNILLDTMQTVLTMAAD
jgi:hypothetical protein